MRIYKRLHRLGLVGSSGVDADSRGRCEPSMPVLTPRQCASYQLCPPPLNQSQSKRCRTSEGWRNRQPRCLLQFLLQERGNLHMQSLLKPSSAVRLIQKQTNPSREQLMSCLCRKTFKIYKLLVCFGTFI